MAVVVNPGLDRSVKLPSSPLLQLTTQSDGVSSVDGALRIHSHSRFVFCCCRSKTEYMCVNEREGSGTVRLQGEEVKKVQEFKYLGSTVQSNGECGKEVKKRVQAGWNGWRKVSGVLCDQKISARIKGKVYRTVVRLAMLYGLETVSLRKRQESELEVAELKMLRLESTNRKAKYVPSNKPEKQISGEDSFELHSVDLELEAMEKQIRDLQVKQTQLRQGKATLESSRTDAHLSQVNSWRETITPTTSTPCASLPRPSARTRPTQVSFTPAPGYHAAWMQQQRKTRAKPRARTSPPPPPPVFEIPTQNRFAPLRETACDAVIIGDSIVRHVRATAAKGKVHTRCLPGARVLDVSAQVPAILKKHIGAVVLHAGTNDIRLRQTEILKKDFRSLVELVRTTSPTTRIIVSGPLPTFQRGIERSVRQLQKACTMGRGYMIPLLFPSGVATANHLTPPIPIFCILNTCTH
ncbi:hypothetical protein QTP86_001941 [Hemibagrus guttatus]|nr:hypothetical protein QTP86_001941 [Hemibagrus guttatus]